MKKRKKKEQKFLSIISLSNTNGVAFVDRKRKKKKMLKNSSSLVDLKKT